MTNPPTSYTTSWDTTQRGSAMDWVRRGAFLVASGSKLCAIGAIAFMQRVGPVDDSQVMAERRATPRARLTISCLAS